MGASCVMKYKHFILASEVETQHNLRKHEIHYLGPQKANAQCQQMLPSILPASL